MLNMFVILLILLVSFGVLACISVSSSPRLNSGLNERLAFNVGFTFNSVNNKLFSIASRKYSNYFRCYPQTGLFTYSSYILFCFTCWNLHLRKYIMLPQLVNLPD